tara:strand:+ start:2269 stop:2805 length:537 start_codon:yes stop_codon:yes gene_type:complete
MRLLIYLIIISTSNVFSQELVLGEERIEPGIVFVFEGAIKDKVYPISLNLEEKYTDVHIEARVNWDSNNLPDGAPPGGFIPYLKMSAIITNQKTNDKILVDLIPHINLIDNFHYAKNISLPGEIDERYRVKFIVRPPEMTTLYFHNDWTKSYSKSLFDEVSFEYDNVDFEEIASSSRN